MDEHGKIPNSSSASTDMTGMTAKERWGKFLMFTLSRKFSKLKVALDSDADAEVKVR